MKASSTNEKRQSLSPSRCGFGVDGDHLRLAMGVHTENCETMDARTFALGNGAASGAMCG